MTGPSLESRGVNKPGISLQPKREANAQSLDQDQMDEDPSSLTGHMLTWLIRRYCHKHLEGKLYIPMCTPQLGKSCPAASNTHTQPSLYPKLAAGWGFSRFQNLSVLHTLPHEASTRVLDLMAIPSSSLICGLSGLPFPSVLAEMTRGLFWLQHFCCSHVLSTSCVPHTVAYSLWS